MISPRRWLLIASLFAAAPAAAQYQTRPWLDWRTIEVGRFALHFPTDLEPWARTVAGKINGIDTAVSKVVGFEPHQRIDVVIDDPFRIPNGSAWPLLESPRLLFWATPPNPRDDIGTFVSWADMLATHEFAHLAHLLRPTRNPTESFLWSLSPLRLGPISFKSPRWVIEGYATYIEGRVTGSGRPNGIWRSSILRRWALEGALPTYAQLDRAPGMYGGEFAYLAGSQFIDWLGSEFGPDEIEKLWRRLSARRDRGFAEAFTGVYGEPPDVLYGRFTARLTADAFGAAEHAWRSKADSGILIQHLSRETGDPAISRDGGRVAISLASATRPGRVVIWRTIPEPDTLADRAAKALLASDPQDVAPVRRFPPPKRALAVLPAVANQPYQDPRFFADGRVLVWRNTAQGDGSWMPELYVWDPQRGTVTRVTRGGNVQKGDPSPDGARIAATRCSVGTCDLVLVDAHSGAVSLLAPGSETRSFYRPRFSPDGRTVLASVRENGFWRLGLVSLDNQAVRFITEDGRNFFDATFGDSAIFATADLNGIQNIVRITDDGAGLGALTSVTGAAVAPEFNPADGSVWYLFLHARGWDVRAVQAQAQADPGTPMFQAARPRLLPARAVGPSTTYSPRRKWVYFPGGSVVRDGGSVLLGLVNTDPVGRTELLIQGAKSVSPRSPDAALEGVLVSLTNRTRVPTVASLFSVRQDGPFWYSMRGAAAAMELARRTELRGQRATFGASWSMVRSPSENPDATRFLLFSDLATSATRFRSGRRTTGTLGLHYAVGKRGSESIDRILGTASVTSSEARFSFVAQLGMTAQGSPEPFVIGGSPPTMMPTGVLSQHIAQPALSPFFVGRRLETFRLSVPLAGAQVYGWMGRAYDATQGAPFERVLGAERLVSIAGIPILGTPAARATVGVGRWMNQRPLLRLNPGNPAAVVAPTGKFQLYITTQFGEWVR
jgi:hypothetical protein